VAPCTRTRKFLGRFREGVAAGRFNASFEHRFDLQSRPCAWVRMSEGSPGERLAAGEPIGCDA
jgi:hypothetical protein